MSMDCIILCGGLGTRLRQTIPDRPKALAPINGFPFVDILMQQIQSFPSITRIILATGFLEQDIKNHLAKNPPQLPVIYSKETSPLGTGGALYKASKIATSDHFFVVNGDCYADFFFEDFYDQHLNTGALISLLCPHVQDSSRYGQVIIETETNAITSFQEKGPHKGPGYINGGIYLIKKSVFEEPWPTVFSLEKSVFPKYIGRGLYGFFHEGFFIDIGTPTSYEKAQQLLKPFTCSP